MPSFSSLVDAAKQAAKAPVQSARFDLVSAKQFGETRIKSMAQAAVGGAVNTGISGALGAATQLIEGNPSGAWNTLTSLPGAMIGKLLPFGNKGKGLGFATPTAPGPGNPLAGMSARRDAVLNFNWYALLPEVNKMKLDWYYCEAATVSYRTIDTQQVYRRGHQEIFPKSYSISPFRLTFMLDDSSQAMNYLAGWQDAIMGRSNGTSRSQGAWGRPADYKKNIAVNVLSVNKQVVMRIKYIRAWPTNLDAMTLVSDASGRLLAEVDFVADDATYEFVSAKTVAAPSTTALKNGPAMGSVSTVMGAIGNRVTSFMSGGLSTSSPLIANASSSLG